MTLDEWKKKLDCEENKIILIGQAPGRRGDPREPLRSERLAKLCGLSMARYLETFTRINLIEEWPGKQKSGKGDEFPMELAAASAAKLLPRLENRRVVFLGLNVAAAFQAPRSDFFVWFDLSLFQTTKAAVFPHPSGVNHFWNSAANVRVASGFLRKALKQSKDSYRQALRTRV